MEKKRKKTCLYALNGRFDQLKVDYIPTQRYCVLSIMCLILRVTWRLVAWPFDSP